MRATLPEFANAGWMAVACSPADGGKHVAVRAARPRFLEPRPSPPPATGDAVLPGDAPRAVPARACRDDGVLRDVAGRHADRLHQRLLVPLDAPAGRGG